MSSPAPSGRWGTWYDADHLLTDIRILAQATQANFYGSPTFPDPSPCQGDIVRGADAAPLLGAAWTSLDLDHPSRLWLILGNTCDFSKRHRTLTQMAPITALSNDPQAIGVRRYETTSSFYLPGIPEFGDGFADLSHIVTVQTAAIEGPPAARLHRASWRLLHCCLVRHLARDDGRFD